MNKAEAVEKLAEELFNTQFGVLHSESLDKFGFERLAWRIPGNIEWKPDFELSEWEREEYRNQARLILSILINNPLIMGPYEE